MPGEVRGGGGNTEADKEHHQTLIRNKLQQDLKMPKVKDTGRYICSGDIGYNTIEGEGYKVKSMVSKYEGREREEEQSATLSLVTRKEYSFGKLMEEQDLPSSPAKRRKVTPPTGPQPTCARPPPAHPWTSSPTSRSTGPGSRWRKPQDQKILTSKTLSGFTGNIVERGLLSDRQKGDLHRVPFVNQNGQTAHLLVKGVADTPASLSSASGGSSSSSTSVGTTSKKEMEITIIKSKENSDKSASQDSKEERRHLASSKITFVRKQEIRQVQVQVYVWKK